MKSKFLLKAVFSLVLLGCLILFWAQVGSMFLADFFSAQASKALEVGEVSYALKYQTEAVDLNSLEPTYFVRRAGTLLAMNAKEEALRDISTALTLNDRNLATLRNSIPLMYYLGVQDSAEDFLDGGYLPKTREFYTYLFETYSTDVGVLVALAYYQSRLGLVEDLDQTLTRIEELRPDLLEWHPLLLGL